MSKYIEKITTKSDQVNPTTFITDQVLSGSSAEKYDSSEAMEEGSLLVQCLSVIEGIKQLSINDRRLKITFELGEPSHLIVAEITPTPKDFFL